MHGSTGSSNRRVFVATTYADIAFARDHGATALLLYQYLSLRMGCNAECWPSYSAISRDTGLARATIAKNIDILVAAGALTVTRTPGGTNHYTVEDLQEIEQPQPQPAPATSSEIERVPVQKLNTNNHQGKNHQEDTYSDTAYPHSLPAQPEPTTRSEKQRERDGVAETLGALWGGIPGKEESSASLFWKTVSSWQATGFSHADIVEAHNQYRIQHPTWDCTMTAVAKHARSLLATKNLSPSAPATKFQRAAANIRQEIARAGLSDRGEGAGIPLPLADAGRSGQLAGPHHRYLSSVGPSEGGDGGFS